MHNDASFSHSFKLKRGLRACGMCVCVCVCVCVCGRGLGH